MSDQGSLSRMRSRDQRLSFEELMRLRKQQLKHRCESYGLNGHGTKEALVNRLLVYLKSSTENTRNESTMEQHLDDLESASNVLPPNPTACFPVAELRALIREEISNASQNLQRNTTPQHAPVAQELSPASTARNGPATLATPAITAQQSTSNAVNLPFMDQQGNSNTVLLPTPKGCLPPLSLKIIKAIQNKDYVDFNALLPNSLYDGSDFSNQFTLTFNSAEGTDKSIAVTPQGGSKQKINSVASWFERGSNSTQIFKKAS